MPERPFEIRNLREIARRLGKRELESAKRVGLLRGTLHIVGEVQEETPVNKDVAPGQTRGELAAAWTGKISGRGRTMEGRISNPTFYGPFVNFGTGIFGPSGQPIRPVRAKALHFFINGREIFARSVRGQRGQHFAEAGFNRGKDRAQRLIIEALQERLAGREPRA